MSTMAVLQHGGNLIGGRQNLNVHIFVVVFHRFSCDVHWLCGGDVIIIMAIFLLPGNFSPPPLSIDFTTTHSNPPVLLPRATIDD